MIRTNILKALKELLEKRPVNNDFLKHTDVFAICLRHSTCVNFAIFNRAGRASLPAHPNSLIGGELSASPNLGENR